MPPSPTDWRPADHLGFFLLDLPNELDFEVIVGPCRFMDARGEEGFNPLMMTLLLLYAFCVGIASSRRIERPCYEDGAFRVLTGNQQPDHSRISEFRHRNLKALEALFVEVLKLCQKAGMVSLGHVALDSTKVEANASKHNAMSHERMHKAEPQLVKEDDKYGKGKRGDGLPEDLEPQTADTMPRRGLPTNAAGVPDAKAQRNVTDPDSHIVKRDNSFIQGYNCQAAVDGDHQIMVAIGVSNQATDGEHHTAGPNSRLSQKSWLRRRTYGVMGGNWSLAPWPPSPPIGLLLPAT